MNSAWMHRRIGLLVVLGMSLIGPNLVKPKNPHSIAFRTSGSTGTEMSGRDLNSKRPLHRLIDFAASELESYQKGCRKQQG